MLPAPAAAYCDEYMTKTEANFERDAFCTDSERDAFREDATTDPCLCALVAISIIDLMIHIVASSKLHRYTDRRSGKRSEPARLDEFSISTNE